MAPEPDNRTSPDPAEARLREMSASLLRAIEAEPVPDRILALARDLAGALEAHLGVYPVQTGQVQEQD